MVRFTRSGLAVAALCAAAVIFGQSSPEDEAIKRERENDVKIGKEYSERLDKELKFVEDAEKVAFVARIGAKLAEVANATPVSAQYGDKRFFAFEYTFKLIEDKDVNAFSIPGGFIYVHSGLLDYVQSEDELAAVISHEIAHAAHRHVPTLIKERSKIDLWTLPVVIGALLSGSPEAGTILFTKDLLTQALTSGWSQLAEVDADFAGAHYMLKTDYNPVALLTFMERLAYRDRNGPNFDLGIHRTHPPSKERARALLRFLKEHGVPIERSKVTTEFRVTSSIVDTGIQLKFGQRPLFVLAGDDAAARADEMVLALNRFFDATPQQFEVKLSGRKILWNSKTLLEFDERDAREGVSPQAFAAEAYEKIRGALFALSMRITN